MSLGWSVPRRELPLGRLFTLLIKTLNAGQEHLLRSLGLCKVSAGGSLAFRRRESMGTF